MFLVSYIYSKLSAFVLLMFCTNYAVLLDAVSINIVLHSVGVLIFEFKHRKIALKVVLINNMVSINKTSIIIPAYIVHFSL